MTTLGGSVGLQGKMSMKVTRQKRNPVFWWKVRQMLFYRWRELPLLLMLTLHPLLKPFGVVLMYGTVSMRKVHDDGSVSEYGTVGKHLITTAGKNYVASTFNNVAEPELFKFHGFGTGSTAAVVGDTTLQTELTTQYATDNTRPTGSQANATNTYTTVATVTPDAAVTITEWGLFTATSAGTLLDRQVFTGVALNGVADSLQITYVLTVA